MNPPALIRASMTLLLSLSAALCAVSSGAGAATVYRCGAAGNSFSDTPCAHGRAFEVDDARSDEQREEARRVVDNDRRLAAELQAERLRAAALPAARAGGFSARPGQPAPPRTVIAYDGHRHPKKRLAAAARARWVYDDREEFIAYGPPAAGKPARPR